MAADTARATAAALAAPGIRPDAAAARTRSRSRTIPWTPPAVPYVNPLDIQGAVRAATDYAVARGYATGIGVVDTTNGAAYGGGQAGGYFATESTIKVMIAANLLATGQMSGAVESTARYMIQASDDASANALYWRAGGDRVMAWAAARYGIPDLGTGPRMGSGWWGSFTVSPMRFAQLLAAMKADPAVGPWLMSTMAGVRPIASDGTDQRFGLVAAAPGAAVKQGWGGDVVGVDATVTPSVGWVGGGRYAVALFTMHVPGVPYRASMDISTAQARILMGALR